ncbi:MAG: patatin-like phospholipase family protein [Acidobacteria bacterium]|nr:patatin-like phospholipase family protein [Acidobacteriota bacterium]
MTNGATETDHELPLIASVDGGKLDDGIALCLSGGGYRAMLFHAGTLWYLNDAGFLSKLARVSSVSGGSITAAVLATRWKSLNFASDGRAYAFEESVIAPLRTMAGTTIDVGSILSGVFWFGSVSDNVIKHYRRILFGDRTLQDFPDAPRFVINATNVQTGSLFRFSKPYLADWQIGIADNPRRLVAEAVAASSAFPPVLSPVTLRFEPGEFARAIGPCNRKPFSTEVVLTDGGVYDNMGIETAWKRCRTILVSDAGGHIQPEAKPHYDWARHAVRISAVIDSQVRALRKRQIVSAFESGIRTGAYWGMWTDPGDYPAPSSLTVPADRGRLLAETPTRLAAMEPRLIDQIINFGYAMAERAIRSYYAPDAHAATRFPYPGGI